MTLVIETHQFPSDLVMLDLQGLDIIIGKDWMTKYDGQIDQANKRVMLTTPDQKRIMYQCKIRNEDKQKDIKSSSAK